MLEWLGSSPTEGLTPEQEMLLEGWRDAYLAHGLSTEPALAPVFWWCLQAHAPGRGH